MTIKAQFPDEQSAEGAFTRQPDAFKDWVTANGSSGYPAASGRYHLYVSGPAPGHIGRSLCGNSRSSKT